MAFEIRTIRAFAELGIQLRDFCEKWNADPGGDPSGFGEAVAKAKGANPWFVEENIRYALGEWGELLTEENLREWLARYPGIGSATPKTVGIVMAGNVPLVGFHDFLCVLLSGHRVLAKLSSQDRYLLPFISSVLIRAEPSLAERIQFVEGKMKGFEAVIATGSNNTGRYFEHYFGKKPHIIRKNRNSIALLTGGESPMELRGLAGDIFRYFGLGCRNVSKLYVPEGYDFDPFFEGMAEFASLIDHFKYANNYDYNKAIFLMNAQAFLDNGFLLLKQDPGLSSPIATLHYAPYASPKALGEELKGLEGKLQCTVSGSGEFGSIPFGETQRPGLSDYADGVDTLAFLSGL